MNIEEFAPMLSETLNGDEAGGRIRHELLAAANLAPRYGRITTAAAVRLLIAEADGGTDAGLPARVVMYDALIPLNEILTDVGFDAAQVGEWFGRSFGSFLGMLVEVAAASTPMPLATVSISRDRPIGIIELCGPGGEVGSLLYADAATAIQGVELPETNGSLEHWALLDGAVIEFLADAVGKPEPRALVGKGLGRDRQARAGPLVFDRALAGSGGM